VASTVANIDSPKSSSKMVLSSSEAVICHSIERPAPGMPNGRREAEDAGDPVDPVHADVDQRASTLLVEPGGVARPGHSGRSCVGGLDPGESHLAHGAYCDETPGLLPFTTQHVVRGTDDQEVVRCGQGADLWSASATVDANGLSVIRCLPADKISIDVA
jgi:hypothetical protein